MAFGIEGERENVYLVEDAEIPYISEQSEKSTTQSINHASYLIWQQIPFSHGA